MEGLSISSTSLYSGLKGYWRRRKRRGYERLNGTVRRRKNLVEYKRLRFWKIKLRLRLRLRLRLKLNVKVQRFSLKKLLMNMRDAYVNMMMKLANSRCMSSGVAGFGGDYGFGMRQLKEYDEKVLVEIYKSMIIAQGQLVPRNVAGVGVGVGAGAGAGAGASAARFRTQIMCQP